MALLRDLQELQLKGKRVPGGLSRRIEVAGGYLSLLNDRINELRQVDPEKFIAIWEWLELSPQPSVRHHATEMKASAQREAA